MPLAFDERLAAAALSNAIDMANHSTLSQIRSDGRSAWDVTASEGFYSFPQGQNIARGFPNSLALTVAWACSAPHRQ